MVPHIGVRFNGLPTLAELLFFDKVTVLSSPTTIPEHIQSVVSEMYKVWGVPEDTVTDTLELRRKYDELLSYGLVHNLSTVLDDAGLREFEQKLIDLLSLLLEATEARKKDGRSRRQRHVERFIMKHPELMDLASDDANEHLVYRPLRELIAQKNLCVATSIVDHNRIALSAPAGSPDRFTNAHSMLVVLKQFPVLDPLTVIPALCEIREDEESQRSLRRLRKLMSNLAAEHGNVLEIAEELQELLDQYADFLKRKRITFTKKALGWILSLAPNAAMALWDGTLMEKTAAVLTTCGSVLSLTAEEKKVPGMEAAFILDASNRIQSSIRTP